jgi:hypothetical protein
VVLKGCISHLCAVPLYLTSLPPSGYYHGPKHSLQGILSRPANLYPPLSQNGARPQLRATVTAQCRHLPADVGLAASLSTSFATRFPDIPHEPTASSSCFARWYYTDGCSARPHPIPATESKHERGGCADKASKTDDTGGDAFGVGEGAGGYRMHSLPDSVVAIQYKS